MKSVLLGMSGGVDSSVAAALLKQEGYQVIGITMVLIPNNEEETVKDAKTVADFLGIEHRVLHLEEKFQNKVILPFIDSYQEGSTPNPCILCNEHFKFGAMYQYAKENGYDAFSTTLLVSPYQKHELIIQMAEEAGKEFDIPFYYEDFRKGYQRGVDISLELELYRQPYCGCVFSERDRYEKKPKVKLE